MRFTKKDVIVVVSALIFIAVGLIGISSYKCIEGHKVTSIAFKWWAVPSFLMACCLTYYSNRKTSERIAKWKRKLSLIGITIAYFILIMALIRGYIIAYNSTIGTQRDILINGYIFKIEVPGKKKLLNNSTIFVRTRDNKKFEFDVPHNMYRRGTYFEKSMKIGSLGILYSAE